MDTTELIYNLRQTIDSLPRPEGLAEIRRLEGEIIDLEFESDEYRRIANEILAVVDPPFQARQKRIAELQRAEADDTIGHAGERELKRLLQRNDLAPAKRLELSRLGGKQARLTAWCLELKSDFLLPYDCKIDIWIRDSPRRLEEMKQDRDEVARLRRLRDEVLATIPQGYPRRDALAAWNEIGGTLSAGKHEQWIEECRRRGLLDATWLPQRIMGALFRRLLYGKEPVEKGIFLK